MYKRLGLESCDVVDLRTRHRLFLSLSATTSTSSLLSLPELAHTAVEKYNQSIHAQYPPIEGSVSSEYDSSWYTGCADRYLRLTIPVINNRPILFLRTQTRPEDEIGFLYLSCHGRVVGR